MQDWFTESLAVFDRSPRAQFAVVVGFPLSTFVWIVGRKFVAALAFDGYLAPMTDAFWPLEVDRYKGTPLVSFICFLSEEVRQLRKTRKRLFELPW